MAKVRRVWRNAERAPRAREGGNHSRVWRRMSDPFAGCKESAKQDIGDWDRFRLGFRWRIGGGGVICASDESLRSHTLQLKR